MWPSNATVKVTADASVDMLNSINNTDKKTLDVYFDGISEAGSNTTSQTFTKGISVASIANALFGTWSGTFYYNVESEMTVVTSPYNGICLVCDNSLEECICDVDTTLYDVVNAAEGLGVNSVNKHSLSNFLETNEDEFTSADYDEMIAACQEIHARYIADYAYTYFQRRASELTEEERHQLWNILPDEAKTEIYTIRDDTAASLRIIITEDVDAEGWPVYYYEMRS